MEIIGNPLCENNALSPNLRCAINPYGPCQDCPDFVSRDIKLLNCASFGAYDFQNVLEMSPQEKFAQKLKSISFRVWALARFPLGMFQVTCILIVLNILIKNNYPISKEYFGELLREGFRIVLHFCTLFRLYKMLSSSEVNKTKVFLKAFEPFGWYMIFDVTAKLLLQA